MRLLLLIALAARLFASQDPAAELRLLLVRASEAQARGDFSSAAASYRRAVAIRPDLPELWSNLGLMQYQLRDYRKAEESFRHAVAIDKSLFVPNLFLGLDLLELKRLREAVGSLLAAEKLNPKDTQVLLALGRAFHALFDPAQSRDWYQRAIDIAPLNGDAWYGLGVAYLELAVRADRDTVQRERYQTLGAQALAHAGELEPDSPGMHALLGDVYRQKGMFQEAEREYSKLLALQPGSLAGLAGLAAAYSGTGQLDAAEATARKALAQAAQDGDINLLMGEILLAKREYRAAEPYLNRGLHARPEELPRVDAVLGRVYARTGRPKEAMRQLTQGASSDDDGSVYYELARLYQSLGNSKAAAAAFEKSQQLRANRDAHIRLNP